MKTIDKAALEDLKHLQQVRTLENGKYLLLDSRDGKVYESVLTLPQVIDTVLQDKAKDLGLAPALIPIISAGASMIGSGLNIWGQSKDAKAQQANLEAQQKLAQYSALQSAQQQKTIMTGIFIAGGLRLLFILLK